MTQTQTTPDAWANFNRMGMEEAQGIFRRCCGATVWVDAMVAGRPYTDTEAMIAFSETIWPKLTAKDWREAFAHHPRIGDLDSLRTRFETTRVWANREQAGTANASEATLQALAEGNTLYETRFGYIFIVCATGKTAEEMLALLQARLPNTPEDELPIAAAEQVKITGLRLRKL